MQQFSSEDLKARRARGESKTDLGRLRALSEEQLERDIAADPEFRDIPPNWHEAAEAVMPEPKRLLSLRIDADVVDYFRSLGPGYQTRINAVLRSFVQQQQHDKRAGR
jgi:uncharacterized protein (DUF4415 family)